MYYPKLQTIDAVRMGLTAFAGLNRGEDIAPGELADMENLTSGHYPLLATCPGFRVCTEGFPQGMLAKEQLCYVMDGLLHVGDEVYDLGLDTEPKQLVSMGAYILIFPDEVYFNTADPTDFGPVETVLQENQWHLSPSDAQGNVRTVRFRGNRTPEAPEAGDFWYNNGISPAQLMQYNGFSGVWSQVDSYVRLTVDHYMNNRWPYSGYFTDTFYSGDVVTLQLPEGVHRFDSYEQLEDQEMYEAIQSLTGKCTLTVLDGVSAVIPGLIPGEVSIGNAIRLARGLPRMDFVFECGNRLWGCRYGEQNGRPVNEIYASRLGDFRNFTCFQGVSTDAYTVSVGSDGPFTGAMNYLGCPLFFKENCIHRVYGSMPGEYRIQTTPCMGVGAGNGRSLCLMGDIALYLGKTGVCAYDGAMPTLISQKLGKVEGPAVAGVLRDQYWLSTAGGLYVYDSRRGQWHRRKAVDIQEFCQWNGHLLASSLEENGMMVVDGGTEELPYSFTTGYIAGTQQQVVRSICLRYQLQGEGTVEVEYDSCGHWQQAGVLRSGKLGWANLPLRPRRCDHFRLRVQGSGSLRLHSIQLTLEKGSDLP